MGARRLVKKLIRKCPRCGYEIEIKPTAKESIWERLAKID